MKNTFLAMMIMPLLVIMLILAGIQITGCGGGSSDSTTAMTPEELEVSTAVESFAAAVKTENIDNAKVFLDSNLKYYRTGGLTEDYLQFVERLKDVFAAASVADFRIESLGVVVNSESLAEARGQLEFSYTDGLGVSQSQSESIRMVFEKTGGVWGMIEFARYDANNPGSAFPPAL